MRSFCRGETQIPCCQHLNIAYNKKSTAKFAVLFLLLSHQDSNLDKQNQNLLCYHYTIGQSSVLSVKKRCKDKSFLRKKQQNSRKLSDFCLFVLFGASVECYSRLFIVLMILSTSASVSSGCSGRLSSCELNLSATGNESVYHCL